MIIRTRAIVSNSDMIKNYKGCREKSESLGKIFILKNNQPDAVLFSISEYGRISRILEYIEIHGKNEVEKFVESIPIQEKRNTYSLEQLKDDIK